MTMPADDASRSSPAEEALREGERRYRGLFERSPAGILRSALDGRILDCNDALARMLGYDSCTELSARRTTDLYFDPSDRASILAGLHGEGVVANHELRLRHKNGGLVWALVTVTLLSDPGGPEEVLSTLIDVSDRKRAEAALAESEQRYRELFEASPHAMWVYDSATFRFLAVNDAAVRHYGYSRDEFLHMTTLNIRPPEDAAALREHIARLGPGPAASGAWRHRKKDGTLIEAETQSHALRFGNRPARLVIAIDVTERRRLEAQLRQSQKMEAVGRLAGGVAHDFNNLLTVITGFGEMLLDSPEVVDPARGLVREIVRAGGRAAELTRQLLAFSRQQILAPKVFEVNSLLAGMGAMLGRLLGEDIDLTVVPGPSPRCVKADPGQLEQVILNLAVNARDAMPQGGRLTVEIADAVLDEHYARGHPEVKPGHYVRLAVSDTGCGMDAATVTRIFEPFFTTKEQSQGTGLGLSTVYGIVKQSGGHIEVYSEVGLGTTFKVYVPRHEWDAVDAPAPALPPVRGTETVLVVEDEAGVRSLAQAALQAQGYRVLTAADGEEALRLAASHVGPLHLLLTDVVMPRMCGRELAQAVLPLFPTIRVLYMSGYTGDAVVRHGILESEVAFLQKPFAPSDLARKVREVLDQLGTASKS